MDRPSRGPAILSPPPDTLLRIKNLTTVFDLNGRLATAVDGVSFAIGRGETLGLVGDSGSGKSVTALSILRLVQRPGRIVRGSVALGGRDLLRLSEQEMRRVRSAEIALIVQEPTPTLNPVFTVGDQIAEAFRVHSRCSRREALARALALNSSFIIADEPVSALDASIQAQASNLLMELQKRLTLTYLLTAHDLRLVRHVCDRIAVMYLGRLVEVAPASELFGSPHHPYTKALLAAMPAVDPTATRASVVSESGTFNREAPLREVAPAHWAAM